MKDMNNEGGEDEERKRRKEMNSERNSFVLVHLILVVRASLTHIRVVS